MAVDDGLGPRGLVLSHRLVVPVLRPAPERRLSEAADGPTGFLERALHVDDAEAVRGQIAHPTEHLAHADTSDAPLALHPEPPAVHGDQGAVEVEEGCGTSGGHRGS